MGNKNELERQIEWAEDRIEYYRNMLGISLCPIQKQYYTKAVETEVAALESLRSWVSRMDMEEDASISKKKAFTMTELGKHNGTGGKPAYVAVNGVVYDVSGNDSWSKGVHFGLTPGRDVSRAFAACHMSMAALEKLPKVGLMAREYREDI